jgi:Protein of unknown function (DUF4199)
MDQKPFFKTILPWVGVCAAVEVAITITAILANHIMWASFCFVSTLALMLYFTHRLKKRTLGTLRFGAILAKVVVSVVLVGMVSTTVWFVARHYCFPERFARFQAEQMEQTSERLKAIGMSQEQIDLQISMSVKNNASLIAQILYPIISYGTLGLIVGLIAGAVNRRDDEEIPT